MPSIVENSSVTGLESIVLDPSEEAVGRAEFDLSEWVGEQGPDWGDAQIEAAMADAGRYGQSPIDFRIPNRTVTIPLTILDRPSASFDDARRAIQAKVALFQREGGWLKRNTALGPVYADVVNASLKLGGKHNYLGIDADAVLTLECLPDWYGEEIELDAISETTAPEIVSVLTEGGTTAIIRGDYPGRCRIVVTDASGEDQLGALWAFRSRYYDVVETAAVAYEAEALTPIDTASVATASGASGGASNNAVAHTNLPASIWLSVLSTEHATHGDLTHIGTYRVFARLRSSDGSSVRVRFVWDVGDLTGPTENSAWQFPAANDWFVADLGEIRIDRAPSGTHRWRGHVQAQGSDGGEEVEIDRVWLQPRDEFAGQLMTATSPTEGLEGYSARDEFNQTAGALSGKTLPVGGAWSGAGDADDFSVDTTSKVARRTPAGPDSAATNGRFAVASTPSLSTVVVQTNFRLHGGPTGAAGVIARYASTSQAVLAVAYPVVALDRQFRVVIYANNGSGWATVADESPVFPFGNGSFDETTYSIRLMLAGSRYWVWMAQAGNDFGHYVMSGASSLISSIPAGKVGIYDYDDLGGSNRDYDDFLAYPVTTDAVVFADRSAELRTEGMFRQDSAGVSYATMPRAIGDLPRIPPAGLEERPVEVFVKSSRGDLETLPDTGIDDVSLQVHYRPCWLFVPDAT